MTSSDCLALMKQICPDLQQLDGTLLNFIDRANKRLVKDVLWPDCWMTTQTIVNQQEYQTLPVLKVHAVYVAGQLATQTTQAIMEGRQIQLYDQDPNPNQGFIGPTASTGFVQASGTITTGDVLTTTIGGIPVAYTVQVTDTTLLILATSIASAIAANPFVSPLVTPLASTTTPGQVGLTAAAAGEGGNSITIAASKSGGATETFVASGSTLVNGSNGSGGAPGTAGQWAPHWVLQEPATYPVTNYWYGSLRPDAQPWGPQPNQPPRYYWNGGRVAIVPNTTQAGATIAVKCVRQPDTITTTGQLMTSPDMFQDCIVWAAIGMAHFGRSDSKSLQMAQMAESSYTQCKRDIVLWRGTFEGDMPDGPKMLTQRTRMGIPGSRLRGKR